MGEKQALTAELQKYAENEVLLREGTAVVKALTTKNEEMEKRIASITWQNEAAKKAILQKEASIASLVMTEDDLLSQRRHPCLS